MRTAGLALASMMMIVGVLDSPALRADEKEDKEKWEKQEKILETSDALIENTEAAIKRRELIAVLTKQLQNAERIELFRLDHKRLPEEDKQTRAFHGYAILNEAIVEKAEHRKEIVAFLGKTLHWNHEREGECFRPRHGLRATHEKEMLDYLICFECYRVQVYQGKKHISTLPLLHVKDNIIEQFLREVEKKAKEPPKE